MLCFLMRAAFRQRLISHHGHQSLHRLHFNRNSYAPETRAYLHVSFAKYWVFTAHWKILPEGRSAVVLWFGQVHIHRDFFAANNQQLSVKHGIMSIISDLAGK